jgi:protein SCO1/2
MIAYALPGFADVPLPSDSLYQLHFKLKDQHAVTRDFDSTRGLPTLITMFYADCKSACPLTITTLQQIEMRLGEAQRKQLRVVLVSFDSKHDTPDHLQETAVSHHISSSRWTLAQADAQDVRQLAAALGIQYRQLPSGEFTHSSVITLLDADGKIAAHTTALTTVEPEFVNELKKLTAGK